MSKIYSLHSSAGLIRSNQFQEKADAICVGSFRANFLGWPVKIFEHDTETKEKTSVLICNPDGSVEKPQGLGYENNDLGNSPGATNHDQAHLLLSSYDEEPFTTFYLKSPLPESKILELEKKLGREIGVVDESVFNLYTKDPKIVKNMEALLSENQIEVDEVATGAFKKINASAEMVTAVRKAHHAARKARLPELRVRSSMKFGGGFKFTAHCEMTAAKDKKPPMIAVYVDGDKIGEVKHDRDAARLISEAAERSFKKFLKKELA